MRAGDLDGTRAESGIGVFVGDDRDQAAVFLGTNRNLAKLSDDWRVAIIRRMNGNRAIAQHGFRARRGDGDIVALFLQHDVPVLVLFDIGIGLAARQRVLEVPHMTGHFGVLDLEIGNRCLEMRVPVDQPLAAIDQALVVHVDEDLDHRVMEIRRARVLVGITCRATHGKRLARPVGRGAKPLELTDDGAARLDLLFPDPVQKHVAPHLAA